MLLGVLAVCAAAGVAVGVEPAAHGCSLELGTSAVQAAVDRTAQTLILTLTPADRACVWLKTVHLRTPSGKRLKPRRTGRGPLSIGIGIGAGSGGSSASVSVAGGAGGPTEGVFHFTQSLPPGAPGTGWVWEIEAVDGCRQQSLTLRIPAERLSACARGR